MAGTFGMKVGAHVTKRTVKGVFKKEVLKRTQVLGRIIGLKILQKNLIKYSVPVVSVGLGGSWNYLSTRVMGKVAQRHFKQVVGSLGTMTAEKAVVVPTSPEAAYAE
jgi:hypothetical protein